MARLLLVLFLVVSSAGSSAATLLCFGDSQTSVRPPLVLADTYCAKMAAATGKSVINKGLGGDTTDGALTRISADVLSQPAECVVVMFGVNDGFIDPSLPYDYSTYWIAPKPAHSTLAQYKTNLTAIVNTILASGREVTLITPWAFWTTPHLLQYPFYVDVVKEVGALAGVPVIDVYVLQLNLWWGSQPWLKPATGAPSMWALQNDYQHPSAYGHTMIARSCEKAVNASACACRP